MYMAGSLGAHSHLPTQLLYVFCFWGIFSMGYFQADAILEFRQLRVHVCTFSNYQVCEKSVVFNEYSG